MITFRGTKTDSEYIEKIILERGAADKSDAIRIALQETATKEPKLVIKPQIPPIPDVDKVTSTLNCFVKELGDANRHGWPEHNMGESPERAKKVEEARRRNEAAFEELEPHLQQIRFLIKSIKTCERINMSELQTAFAHLYEVYAQFVDTLKRPDLSEERRDYLSQTVKSLKCMLQFFMVVGVFPEVILLMLREAA